MKARDPALTDLCRAGDLWLVMVKSYPLGCIRPFVNTLLKITFNHDVVF